MPYYPDVAARRRIRSSAAASLWADGRQEKPRKYKGVAKFFTFLSDTDRQAKLHQESGYLPITKAAYEKTIKDGFYDKNPTLQTPLKELTNKEPTENSRGLRFGNMVQMRDLWAEELEGALAGKKTAQEALDAAVARGNAMLRTFEKTAKVATFQDSLSGFGEGAPLASHSVLNGKVCRLQQQAAAISAARAAAHHHIRIFSTGRRARRFGNPSSARTRSG